MHGVPEGELQDLGLPEEGAGAAALGQRALLLRLPSEEGVDQRRGARGGERRERGEEIAERAEASRGVTGAVQGSLRGRRDETGVRDGGEERAGGRARADEFSAWTPSDEETGRVRGVARTALSMDTTLVVYLCRSASVRSMAPTHRPARAARARLSDGRRPRISGDEEKCRAQNDETASSAMFES